ncbi:MAG: hypothetical protein ACKVI4_17865 [Actinomycetales bacterium]
MHALTNVWNVRGSKKTEHDAKAPFNTGAGGGAGGGGGGGGGSSKK